MTCGFADVLFCKTLAKHRKICKNHRYWWLKLSGKWYLCFKRSTEIGGYIAVWGGFYHGFMYDELVPAFKLRRINRGTGNQVIQ
jgi:hypothetical protein